MSDEFKEFKAAKNITEFMPQGPHLQIKLLDPVKPPLGRKLSACGLPERLSLKLPTPGFVMVAEVPEESEPVAQARQKLKEIREKVLRAVQPKEDESRAKISVERIVFLERLERLMSNESRVKELESENRTLVRAIGRLQDELDALRAKPEQKS